MEKPDYEKLRRQKGFDWYIGISGNSLWKLAEIPIHEFYLKPEACIEAYKKGRPILHELFGEDVPVPVVSTPMIKYGHLNTLGAEVKFPEGGEPHHSFLFDSPEEGISQLKEKQVDFASSGRTPFFLEFRKKMQEAFSDEPVKWGWQWEGPVTTAWGLLGESFMYDLYDKPDELKEFMRLATASMVEFCRFFCKVEGTEVLDTEPDHGRLCDDIAAMVPANMWDDFVLPFWDMYYAGPAPGRIVHCEDMRAEQLGELEKIGIVDYDPGISPKLTTKIVGENTPIPFGWRLPGFSYGSMSLQDVENFVYQAAADGASYVHTHIEAAMCDEQSAEKVRAFIKAAKQAKQLIGRGASRQELRMYIGKQGRKKIWEVQR
jgi:hypothetical protein